MVRVRHIPGGSVDLASLLSLLSLLSNRAIGLMVGVIGDCR